MRRLQALAAFTLPLVLLAAPAHAERWSGDDPVGDVEGWHYVQDPEPCGTETAIEDPVRPNEDITRLTARHARSSLRLVLSVDDLDKTIEQSVTFRVATPRRDWWLMLTRERARSGDGFRVSTRFFSTPDLAEDDCWFAVIVDRCKVTTVFDFDADTVAVTMPRSCLHTPPWVRVGAATQGTTQIAADKLDYFRDWWGEHAEGESTWNPPLGPEVHAPGH